MHDPETIKWFGEQGLTPPSHTSHDLTPNDIARRVTPLKPRNWRLEGNKLIADTDWGPLVNYIPTDYILTGTDGRGLPILKKL